VTPQLCVLVQSLSASAQVQAGTTASFAIWVWSTLAASTGVVVKAQVAAAPDVSAPKFTVCPSASGATCKLGNLPVGQADELEATVQVNAQAGLGEELELTAQVSAPGATQFSGTASDVVVLTPTPSSAGSTVTLPVPEVLPAIPGTGISPTNPSGLFPTVGASPTTGTGSLGLPPAQGRATLHAANTAAAVPLDAQLLGGQVVGLVVLAGAVTIAIARLSLRKPKINEDPGASRPS
jgi:hypothetical protein